MLRWPGRTDWVALLIFAVCSLGLFRLSLFEGWTFVGDSDRLNTVLNVRLFEVLSLLHRGSVPAWSEQQFMGYGIVGLHWMLPGAPPIPQLLALLPLSQLYHALAYLTALLLLLAMLTAYLALGAYSAGPVQRVVGALLYATGMYTFHKMMQLDISFSALVFPPLLVWLTRVTRRETVHGTFLGMVACWAFMVEFTVLQEIAYIALLWGTYALYRTARLRDPWPLVAAGLAFVGGVVIGAPRVLTIAADIPFVTRTQTNIETTAIEGLRFFGDGLLGRTQGEQGLLRGPAINMHEGVQLLSSELAAIAVIALGLVSPSRSLRLWSVALLVVLSVALNAYFRPFYELEGFGLRGLTYPSRELRTVLINAVSIGLPAWLLGWWATRGAKPPHPTPATISDDLPFFYGFVVLALAAILIPEARTVLYYGFLKMDFLHSRICVAMTFPLAALAVIFLNRFLPSWPTRETVRWLAGGLLLGLAIWLVREWAAETIAAQTGLAVEAFRPRRLLTLEVVKVGTSLLLLVVACAVLLTRRIPSSWLTLTGGLLAVWMALEAVAMTDHRLNGPQATAQARPFSDLDYMQAPPGLMNVPSDAQRAAVRERLEVDRYRSILLQDRGQFLALVEPHLSAFWDLRLVEGYSTGLPRRLGDLPWTESMVQPHHLDVHSIHPPQDLPWKLLAALNVKYVVMVDRGLWYNPAPGSSDPPLDPSKIELLTNPNPVTPRAFFAATVSPAGAAPRLLGDDGKRPAPKDSPIEEPARHSIAEGWPAERQLSTAGAIDATFDGDRVLVRVERAAEDRFLVLNEMYHPLWQATVDGAPATIYPTNLVMRGILVPAGAATVELRYVPFLATARGIGLLAFGLALIPLIAWGLKRVGGRQ